MASILLVDDNAELLMTQVEFLLLAGHSTTTVANGKEALLLIKIRPFDLVITDVIMPEKDGLETIVQLLQQNPQQKIIAISGGGWIEPKDYLAVARKLGAVCTLAKPFTGKQLMQAVEKVLRN